MLLFSIFFVVSLVCALNMVHTDFYMGNRDLEWKFRKGLLVRNLIATIFFFLAVVVAGIIG